MWLLRADAPAARRPRAGRALRRGAAERLLAAQPLLSLWYRAGYRAAPRRRAGRACGGAADGCRGPGGAAAQTALGAALPRAGRSSGRDDALRLPLPDEYSRAAALIQCRRQCRSECLPWTIWLVARS